MAPSPSGPSFGNTTAVAAAALSKHQFADVPAEIQSMLSEEEDLSATIEEATKLWPSDSIEAAVVPASNCQPSDCADLIPQPGTFNHSSSRMTSRMNASSSSSDMPSVEKYSSMKPTAPAVPTAISANCPNPPSAPPLAGTVNFTAGSAGSQLASPSSSTGLMAAATASGSGTGHAAAAARLSLYGSTAAAPVIVAGGGDVVTEANINLPKPTMTDKQRVEYPAMQLVHQQAIAVHRYRKRGPQAIRRTLMRRMCELIPAAQDIYNQTNNKYKLSSKGKQWEQRHCEEFFALVIGPYGPLWPAAAAELRPFAELDYLARLLTAVLGKTVTAAEVNECFEPGHKEWKVTEVELRLLGVPEYVELPLFPTGATEAPDSVDEHNTAVAAYAFAAPVTPSTVEAHATTAAGHGQTALAAAALSTQCRSRKRRADRQRRITIKKNKPAQAASAADLAPTAAAAAAAAAFVAALPMTAGTSAAMTAAAANQLYYMMVVPGDYGVFQI